MRQRPQGHHLLLVPIGLLGVLFAIACGVHQPTRRGSAAPIVARERTVFSDTALYRAQCVEADSGLTPASGRCTLRDQGRPRAVDRFSPPRERPAP